MIGEGPQDTDGPGKLDQAREAVQAATQTVKETTRSGASSGGFSGSSAVRVDVT
jgi:hypothetical protein